MHVLDHPYDPASCGHEGLWSRRQLIRSAAAAAVGAATLPLHALAESRREEAAVDSPAAALARLLEGNRRFVDGKPIAPHRDRDRVLSTSVRQTPFAAILGCSDSRLPVEIVFDQGFGDLFVVRLAGNIATPESLASLEFGSLVLGARAIVVLGHTRCGAVEAALAGKPVPGQISALYQHIAPSLDATQNDLDLAVEANVRTQLKKLAAGSTVIGELLRSSQVAAVGMVYDLPTGRVRVLE